MNNNSTIIPLNEPSDCHKIVLTYIRRLEKFTRNIPGRNPNELFVTSDQRSYMNEIAKVDPVLLDSTVRRFIIENKLTEKTPSRNIPELREILMEDLTRVSVLLPGHSDEDEEWESSLDNTCLSTSSKSSKSSKSSESSAPSAAQKLTLTSWPTIENPWVTQTRVSTKMPEEYEKYV